VNPEERPSGAAKRVKNNLVALGTAAVLTVYASGYLRTRSAAARFTAEAAERMPAVPSAGEASGPLSVRQPPTTELAGAEEPHAAPKPVRAADSIRATTSAATAAQAAAQVVAPTASASTATTTAATTTAVATPPAGSTGTEVPVPAAADSAAPLANKELKDGVYNGWGTSRHGDIQASVEIEGGRIVSAYISQCLTRYPCSWISQLPPQVVTRQSANVDYVSGATQSTNAFYYAVMEALAKAK
jgi:uncharacterized protein with FMN-binding domain